MNLKFVCLAIVFFISGCSTVKTLDYKPTDPQGDEYQAYLQSSNPKLASLVGIVEVIHGYAGDLMRAQVALKNRWSGDLEIQYKFRWFDQSGMELVPEGLPWVPLTLKGGDTIRVQSVAPNPSAKSFRVVVAD